MVTPECKASSGPELSENELLACKNDTVRFVGSQPYAGLQQEAGLARISRAGRTDVEDARVRQLPLQLHNRLHGFRPRCGHAAAEGICSRRDVRSPAETTRWRTARDCMSWWYIRQERLLLTIRG